MMKVSIIVPIYNVSKYIIRCLDSVIHQTYQNIECILVDDSSPDDSIDLAKQKLESYKGIIDFKIIHHEQNRGLSGARNTGTRASTGEYIYYLDSDDEITPDCIDILMAWAYKYPEVEMIQGNTQTIPEPLPQNDWRNIRYKNFPGYINNNNWIREHFYDISKKSIPVNAWNKLIKRDFIFDNNFFFKERVIHEDKLWMFWVVKKLNSMAFTTNYTYIHYITEGSIMQSGNNYNSIQSSCIILKEIFDHIDGAYTKEQQNKYLFSLFGNILRIDLNSKEKDLYIEYKSFIRALIEKVPFNVLPLRYLLLPRYLLKVKIFKMILRITINC